jgi:hypothetical protein
MLPGYSGRYQFFPDRLNLFPVNGGLLAAAAAAAAAAAPGAAGEVAPIAAIAAAPGAAGGVAPIAAAPGAAGGVGFGGTGLTEGTCANTDAANAAESNPTKNFW